MLNFLVVSAALLALDPDAVAARVGEATISVRVVEREMKRATPKLPEDPQALRRLRAATLEVAVLRALVLQELVVQKKAATAADVELAIDRLKKMAAARGAKWDVQKFGLTEAEYHAEQRWRLSWDAYLREQLADDNLRRYFERHQREFDGTTVRVAHVLLKLAPDAAQAEREKVLAKANELCEQIAAGKLTFAAAAEQHSQAPTAKEGGDIGFIERGGPMPEAFSKAAFALEPGQTSAPVETAFGIHLIHCLEVTPGKRTWQEAREDLRTAVTRYLFDWLAERGAKTSKVEYTGLYPHRDPSTGAIVGPE